MQSLGTLDGGFVIQGPSSDHTVGLRSTLSLLMDCFSFSCMHPDSPPPVCGDLKVKGGSTGCDCLLALIHLAGSSCSQSLLLSPFVLPFQALSKSFHHSQFCNHFQKQIEGPWFSHFIHFLFLQLYVYLQTFQLLSYLYSFF